ncbi:nose resistant to fluoxetine protein 6-like isoform X2 [Zophobas morio]|uniref:nose resistant to fluoxetine protein 6-like isoform X2 n=1 Tax=Zophobas morio TaxID=2755281 RepID=UPI0030836E5C
MWLYTYCATALLLLTKSKALSDREYASMPPLFHMDDFDTCMSYGENALYCAIEFQLSPKNLHNTSEVWKIIQKTLSSTEYFKHDLLKHNICVTQRCRHIANVEILNNNSKYIKQLGECYSSNFEKMGLVGEIKTTRCRTNKLPTFLNNYDFLYLALVMFIVLLVLYASLYNIIKDPDLKNTEFEQTIHGKYISAFSIFQNLKRLTTVNLKDPDMEALSCLQGVRVINIVTVIVSHSLTINFAFAAINPRYLETLLLSNNLGDEAIRLDSNYNIVQPILLISSWLLTYNVLKECEVRRKMSISYLVCRFWSRYFRLAPCMAVVLLYSATWMPHLTDGPVWDHTVLDEHQMCRRNWWINLLFLHNFQHFQEMCGTHLWFIAVDLQLYLIGLIILWVIWHYPRKTFWLFGSMWICHVIYVFFRIYNRINFIDLSNQSQFDEENLVEIFNVYKLCWSNIPAVLGGITYGYIFYKYKNKKLSTNKTHVVLWWILSWGTIIGLSKVLGLALDTFQNNVNEVLAFRLCLTRTIYIFGFGLFVLGLTLGQGGLIRKFYTSTPMYILGRLTYGAYLMHVFIIRFKIGIMRTPRFFSNGSLIFDVVGEVVWSFLLSVLVSLFFEMPFEKVKSYVLKVNQEQNRNFKKTE